MSEHSGRISIRVGGPAHKIRRVSVVPASKVSGLSELFEGEKLDFMFMGEILVPHFSFEFYGIHSGSFVTVIPQGSDTVNLATWAAVSRDSDHLGQMIGFSTNRETRAEVARLKDLRMMKYMAKSPKHFMGVLSEQQSSSKSPKEKTELVTSIWTKGNAPNCEPLPAFWPEVRA